MLMNIKVPCRTWASILYTASAESMLNTPHIKGNAFVLVYL